MLYSRTPFDNLTEVLTTDRGDNLTEGELYFWAGQKKAENLLHIQWGHERKYGKCRTCGNCLCDRKRFRCLCSAGKVFVTPYKIRSRF